MRRRLVGSMRCAATGSSAARRACRSGTSTSAGVERGLELARPPRGSGRGWTRSSMTERRYRPVPPTSTAWCPRCVDVVQCRPGGPLEFGDGELLVRIDQIDQVVRDLGPHFPAGLGGPEIHLPVDAHGVDRDDLDITPAAGHLQGGLRLSRCSDADEGDCGQALATGIRMRWRGRAITRSSRPVK